MGVRRVDLLFMPRLRSQPTSLLRTVAIIELKGDNHLIWYYQFCSYVKWFFQKYS
jgi:hypothetical protein